MVEARERWRLPQRGTEEGIGRAGPCGSGKGERGAIRNHQARTRNGQKPILLSARVSERVHDTRLCGAPGPADGEKVTVWAVKSAETLGAACSLLAAGRHGNVKDTEDKANGNDRGGPRR